MRILPVLALLAACGPDLDGDGSRRRDCDDTQIAVHPRAIEVCNGIDDDCDGQIDEDVAIVAYWDRDGDGYGDTEAARRVCELPIDGSLTPGDCNDLDPLVHPDQVEVCNQRDDDCNGAVDDNDVQLPLYTDADGDGDGAGDASSAGCGPSEGLSLTGADCDDSDPTRASTLPERCDGLDNDCDGDVDEGAITGPSWVDADGDGFGDPSRVTTGCGEGAVGNADDCDDTDPTLSPAADEQPGNGISDDCDRWVDEITVPGSFATLSEALDQAPPGAVVQLGVGTWMQAVDLSGRDLTLAGAGCGATLLYGDGSAPVVTTDGAQVHDLTLAGGGAPHGGGLRVLGDTIASGLCVRSNVSSESGGGVAVESGRLELSDTSLVDNQSSRDGGGAWVAPGASLTATRVDFRQNQGSYGGGLAVESGDAVLSSVVFAGNHARSSGGGFSARNPAGEHAPVVRGSHLTLVGNSARSTGAAVYNYASDVALDHAVFAYHSDDIALIQEIGSLSQTEDQIAVWGNLGPTHNWGTLPDARHVTPRFVQWSASTPASEWDLHLVAGSELIDASTSGLDADGSAADLGAYGGIDAPVDAAHSYTQDTDGDGMSDGWELASGQSPWLDDALTDIDGDGLSALDELLAGTSPSLADTDGDGISDGDELATGSAPLDPRDHQPVPILSPGAWIRVGDAFSLDGSGSYVADGTAPVLRWTVQAPAGGSASAWAETGDHGVLTPDAPGEWVLTLTVAAHGVQREQSTVVHAVSAVTVPDDYPDLAQAVASVPARSAVALRPGVYTGAVDLGGKDLTIIGLGDAEQVVLDAQGEGSVLRAAQAEVLRLAQLTLTGGDAPEGGGLLAGTDTDVLLDDVIVRGNRAVSGGGIASRSGKLALVDVTLADNDASTQGGGLFSSGSEVLITRGSLHHNTADQGGGWASLGSPSSEPLARNTQFDGNRANTGAALYQDASKSAALEHVSLTGNQASLGILYAKRSTISLESSLVASNEAEALLARAATGAHLSPVANLWWGNHYTALSEPLDDGFGDEPHRVEQPPHVISWPPDGSSPAIFAPLPGSPLRDGGHPERVDRDTTRADVGPWGGPDAPWDAEAAQRDADGDGLNDRWELLGGLSTTSDDRLGDEDGDGLSNELEQQLGTRPDLADTDGDGVSDAVERDLPSDPLDPRDHRPLAVVSAPARARQHEAVTLDATASYDPDGNALSYTWAVVEQPSGSAITPSDFVGDASATFVPTHRGRYRVSLVVSDGSASSLPLEVSLQVAGDLRVPDDAPSLEDALAVAIDGDTILLPAGSHRASLDVAGTKLTLRGAGAAQTVLLGSAAAPVAVVRPGGELDLQGLSLSGGIGDTGGGVECDGATLALTDVRVIGNAGYSGGGVGLSSCTASFRDVDVSDNASVFSGGGLYVRSSELSWTRGSIRLNRSGSSGGGAYFSSSTVALHNIVVDDNLAKSAGGAFYQSSTALDASHLSMVRNDGRYGAWYVSLGTGHVDQSLFAENSGYALYVVGAQSFTADTNAFWLNETNTTPSSLVGTGDILVDPRLVSADDLHLQHDSPLRDAGRADCSDPDGTRCDIGALGGPDAPTGFDRAYVDADMDGLPDAWALQYSQALPSADDDGDGLSALEELGAGTDPTNADTDGDGVSDGDEFLAGTDPLKPEVALPVAVIAAADIAPSLQPTLFDGTTSSAATGVSAYRWTLAARPGRSSASLATTADVTSSLTPDVPGAYTVELRVSDGQRWSLPVQHTVRVTGAVLVPEDYATVDAAVRAAVPGEPIHIAAGTWPTRLDLDGSDLHLVGAGRDLTVLDAGRQGRVIGAPLGGALTLEGLTLAGGVGELGGAVFLVGGSATLRDVALRDNVAVQGGALYSLGATLALSGVSVTDNDAARYGGGLSIEHCTLTGEQLFFANNHAQSLNGGAVYGATSSVAIDQAVFHENSALYGGALYLTGSSATPLPATLSHVTATYNTASAGGGFVRLSVQDLSVADSIIAHTPSGSAIYLSSSSSGTYTQTNSILFDSDPRHTTNTPDPTGSADNIDADPLLDNVSADGDWSNDRWWLLPGSPALDVGPGLDADGSPADRGAFGGVGGTWQP